MTGISGAGLGLRREFLHEVIPSNFNPDWFEITPENWINMPYMYRESFEQVAEKFPLVCHGLSLSIGSPEPLDKTFLTQLKDFLDRYKVEHYSEHLSFSTFYGAQTYELLPLPMTQEMIHHVADRVKQVQDFLQRPLILENATYYHVPYMEMREVDFLNQVMHTADTKMLLDVNNVYVNTTNHNLDAKTFMDELDVSKAAYIHMAGHTLFEEENLIIDTHGEEIITPVWDLLDYTLDKISVPVMIERDNDVPSLAVMQDEYTILKDKLTKRYHA